MNDERKKNYLDSIFNEEVNLSFIWGVFVRNKKLISLITLISIFMSLLSFIRTKKTWEGQFQIVLSSENITDSFVPNDLSEFSGFGSKCSFSFIDSKNCFCFLSNVKVYIILKAFYVK